MGSGSAIRMIIEQAWSAGSGQLYYSRSRLSMTCNIIDFSLREASEY
jgi:hypothetical protein